jgi:hypothetical protein
MPYELQKWLRFITPAIIAVGATWLFGRITGLWEFAFPANFEEWAKSLWGLFLGLIYYVTPARELSNRPYFSKVIENLRVNLLRIAEVQDNPGFFTWEKLRPIFWNLVDNDKSLTKKTSQAYFNGYLWTSVADCRAICLIFFVFSLGVAATGNESAPIAAGAFLIIASMTLWFSKLLTKRHVSIGNEQLEIIAQFYRERLRDQVNAITA